MSIAAKTGGTSPRRARKRGAEGKEKGRVREESHKGYNKDNNNNNINNNNNNNNKLLISNSHAQIQYLQ